MSIVTESKNAKASEPTEASIKNVETTSTNITETPELSESEFTRAAIEGLGNRVRVTDSDEATGLELFCYVRCGPEDTGIIRECRGVVFHEEDIVMRAFPYTVEYGHNDEKKIEETVQPVFKDCSFYDAHEGALIRMFNYSGRWFTSTHRKLNAFRSKWASNESFGTSFKRALESELENNKVLKDSIPDNGEGLLERFQTTLDPTKQYMFLIRHSKDNRIVCAPPSRPTLFHVGTFVNGDLVMTENINVPYPRKHTFLSMDGLVEHVNKTDIRDLQGIIAFAPDNKQYKILHKDYQDLFRARGNEPSIKFRYLQVRMNENMVNMLYHLYPDMGKLFDEYENILYSIAKVIYHSYVQRYIKKKWVTVAGEEFNVVRECHAWHEEDRKINRISVDKVIEILNAQTPTNLNKMIRRFHNEKDRQQETQQDVKYRNRSNTISSATNSPAVQGTNVSSPLLLTKNRKRNPTLPPAPILGPPATTPQSPKTRVLSEEPSADFQQV
jgi:hypothetical protein